MENKFKQAFGICLKLNHKTLYSNADLTVKLNEYVYKLLDNKLSFNLDKEYIITSFFNEDDFEYYMDLLHLDASFILFLDLFNLLISNYSSDQVMDCLKHFFPLDKLITFLKGQDIPYYIKELNELAIKQFNATLIYTYDDVSDGLITYIKVSNIKQIFTSIENNHFKSKYVCAKEVFNYLKKL